MTARPLPRAAAASFAGCILPLLCLAGSALAAPSARSPRPAAQPGTSIIEVQQGGGGTIVPDGFVSVPAGGSQAFEFIPDDCYRVADVQVDGESVGSVTGYTFTNVQSDHLIYVMFSRPFFTITATSGPGGTTSPSGAVSLACGANLQVDMLSSCLQVTDLQVDDVSLGPLIELEVSQDLA